jgi:hypothetical protein
MKETSKLLGWATKHLNRNADALTNLSERDLKDIKQLRYDHADDSQQPQACG